ncbi:MAG TPA: CvpA family protein [Mariprofundaceae bacterium]|nr:CvpA family protein [Mariprofundaceae bacterium]
MNFFDYVLIAIVGLSMVLSLWRGFVREIISLIGLVAAFMIASRTSAMAGDFLGNWMPKGTVSDIAGFVLIFVTIMLVIGLTGVIIRKLVDMAQLTATDRTLGVFFGFARGLLLIALSFLIFTTYDPKHNQTWLRESMLSPYAIELGDLLGKAIPKGYPFSRQGQSDKIPVLNKSATSPEPGKEQPDDQADIPAHDREMMKSIIQKSMK